MSNQQIISYSILADAVGGTDFVLDRKLGRAAIVAAVAVVTVYAVQSYFANQATNQIAAALLSTTQAQPASSEDDDPSN
jgi:hypothetical protein